MVLLLAVVLAVLVVVLAQVVARGTKGKIEARTNLKKSGTAFLYLRRFLVSQSDDIE